ncbi:MAG: hypothetical protein K0S76_2320 [Herbinix sp.]|jgi:hypothetical protein|nr:hypothetical protein [Herbinix sp.]
MFYDKKSKSSVYFCNRPNCSHGGLDEDCSSFAMEYIGYYDGYLYTLTDDVNRIIDPQTIANNYTPQNVVNYYLTRYKEDSTDKEIVAKLFTQYFGENENGQFVSSTYMNNYLFHRGYFYYALNSEYKDESILFIKRWNLKEQKEEVLFSYKQDSNVRFINTLKGFGPYIYYINRGPYSDEFQVADAKLCRIHIDTGNIDEIDIDSTFQDYFIVDGDLYYVSGLGKILYKMNMDTMETKKLIEITDDTYIPYFGNVNMDQDYIYIDNLSHNLIAKEDYDIECRVFDKEGALVDVIDLDGNYSCKPIGVSGDKLMIAWASKDNRFAYDYYTLDKSRIGTGVHTLEKLIEAAD